MRNMGDYHDLYLQTDVLLLSDVFERFRSTCLGHYGLDPVHFVSAPAMTWQAALKTTRVRLELLTDLEMYQFVEKGTHLSLFCLISTTICVKIVVVSLLT